MSPLYWIVVQNDSFSFHVFIYQYLWSCYGYIGLLYCSIVLSPVTKDPYMESIDQNIKTIDLLYLIIFRPNRLGPVLSELFKSGFRWQIQTLFDMDSINTSDTRVVVWNIQVQILLVELTFDLKKAPLYKIVWLFFSHDFNWYRNEQNKNIYCDCFKYNEIIHSSSWH